MDSNAITWIIVIIVIVFFGIGIYFYRKEPSKGSYREPYRDDDDSTVSSSSSSSTTSLINKTSTTSTTGTSSVTTAKYTGGKQVENKLSGPPQRTIYSYRVGKSTTLCPYCDGENKIGTKVCSICRRDL